MKHKRRGLHGWVLYALEISPKNGAEIMDAMENMSPRLVETIARLSISSA